MREDRGQGLVAVTTARAVPGFAEAVVAVRRALRAKIEIGALASEATDQDDVPRVVREEVRGDEIDVSGGITLAVEEKLSSYFAQRQVPS